MMGRPTFLCIGGGPIDRKTAPVATRSRASVSRLELATAREFKLNSNNLFWQTRHTVSCNAPVRISFHLNKKTLLELAVFKLNFFKTFFISSAAN